MERGLKIWYVTCILLLTYEQSPVQGEQQVPCYFIFGNSLGDNGNNNGLATRAKANFSPYGIDFPYGPTGRFCNGRTMAGIIAELLGFENYIPSFATASGQDILKGVNYASAPAGIRSESGQQMGARISMDAQLGNHLTTVSRIAAIFRVNNATTNYLSKCIYSVGMGNNDFTNNYFMPQFYPTSHLYTPDQYATVLVNQYSQRLRAFYRLGARKVALFGLGQLGCTPFEMARSCNRKQASCEVETGMVTCIPLSTPCSNRTQYEFWDMLHPTEVVHLIFAGKAYNAQSLSDTYPIYSSPSSTPRKDMIVRTWNSRLKELFIVINKSTDNFFRNC
ncbi:hypothetical protein SO802_007931 [Lithocarpus litseifolius]|uniref:Uncharacterized protein n=1 Tax=Lithocarpus litseifolius TaxID=425828 RepID=A0AAW2DTD0_9ROSI